MAKNKKKKPQSQQKPPKSNIADAEFKKKVTIFNGCLLLVFIIALVSFLIYSAVKTETLAERFQMEVETVKQAVSEAGEDKSVVKIEVSDEMFVDWSELIFHSYQEHTHENEEEHSGIEHGYFEGCTIHIQGVFETVDYGGVEQYQIYRKYIDVDGKENKVPTEIIFEGEKPEKNKLPKDGDWVDVVGIVSSNSNGLSCIKDAKVTILNIEDKKEFAK